MPWVTCAGTPEIASIEQQHVTQYESLMDPGQSLLENWLMHEAMEVYNYYGCVQQENNPRIRAIWERMLDYELGHFAVTLWRRMLQHLLLSSA